ncbi:MAG: hypothetical protein ACXVXP_03875 [Mycobacteriaceae bacterium]
MSTTSLHAPQAEPLAEDMPSSRDGFSWVAAGAAWFALLALMLRLTIHASAPLDNGDTWFHLRIGEQLLGPWSLSHPGRLSSFATSSWVPTQWSTEMVAALFERWFGLPGVAWLFGLLFLVFVVLLYAGSRRLGDPLPAAVATGLAVIGTAGQLSARPQVVSLILMVVVVAAWLRTAEDGRVRWWLVPMTWFWATAHGLWSAGVLVGFVACVGLALDGRIGDRHEIGKQFAIPVLSLFAAAITPIGPRLLVSQFAVSARASLIGEWGPTSFRDVPPLMVTLMIGVVILVWARASRPVPWTRLLLLGLACGWTLLVDRMVAFGAVVAAPLMAEALQQILPGHSLPIRLPRVERWALGLGTLVLVAGLAVAVPSTAATPGGVPTALTPRLAALPAGSPVLVEDSSGAWMEWRFHDLNPVIDGMFDAYPVSYLHDFADFRDLQPGWQKFVVRSRASVAVLPIRSALEAALERELHWRQLQRAGKWVYLVAPGS